MEREEKTSCFLVCCCMKKDEYQRMKDIVSFEQKQYYDYAFGSKKEYYWGSLLGNPICLIMKWQKYSRMTDYYIRVCVKKRTTINIIKSKFYMYLRNKYANKCGFEISTANIGKGFMVYHIGSTVINPGAILGEQVHLHGNNCIGNGGEGNFACPIIGNRVKIGVGAKVIGGISIADDCYIGASSLVNHSFNLDGGAIIAGVPAKIIKKYTKE